MTRIIARMPVTLAHVRHALVILLAVASGAAAAGGGQDQRLPGDLELRWLGDTILLVRDSETRGFDKVVVEDVQQFAIMQDRVIGVTGDGEYFWVQGPVTVRFDSEQTWLESLGLEERGQITLHPAHELASADNVSPEMVAQVIGVPMSGLVWLLILLAASLLGVVVASLVVMIWIARRRGSP